MHVDEARFIAAVVKDDTGERLEQCRRLPAEAFSDEACARAWRDLTRAPSYELGATSPSVRSFFAHETLGASFASDRDALFIAWLRCVGLDSVDRWLATLPRKQTDAAWQPTNAAALCERPPVTPPEILHGLLYRGGTMMLSGASKSRKTYTMLAAGIAIASGRDWLGFSTSATPVVYLNLELQDFAAQNRIGAICRAMGVTPPATLHVVNLRGTLVTVDAFEARIGQLLTQTTAGLVIVDPHYKLASASGTDENSNDAQAALLYRLESAVCSRGAALMLAHHFAKGDASAKRAIDRAAGGGALARFPDVVATMTEHEEPDCMTVELALRNFAPISPFVLRWRQPIWTRDEAVDPSKLKRAGRATEHQAHDLLALLCDGMSFSEWRDAAGWSESTFRRRREELIRGGRVRSQSGCYYRVVADAA